MLQFISKKEFTDKVHLKQNAIIEHHRKSSREEFPSPDVKNRGKYLKNKEETGHYKTEKRRSPKNIFTALKEKRQELEELNLTSEFSGSINPNGELPQFADSNNLQEVFLNICDDQSNQQGE